MIGSPAFALANCIPSCKLYSNSRAALTNSTSDQHSLFQAERLLQYFRERINNPLPNLTALRQQFYNYITEYDRRTGCNFVQEFPEMQDFFNMCNNNGR